MALLLVVFIGWMLIRATLFQTWVVNQVAHRVERDYGGYLEIGSIDIRFPKHIIAKDVLLRDQLGDTLCFVPEIDAGIKSINFGERIFELKRVKLRSPYLQLKEDPAGGYNFDFAIDMLTPKDSVPKPIFITSPLISVRNGLVKFRKFGKNRQPGQFNPENIKISGLDLNLFRFDLNPDSLNFRLRNIHLKEASGFLLDDLDGEINISDGLVKLNDLKINTPFSSFDIPKAKFEIPEPGIANIVDKLDLELNIEGPSRVDNRDISYFYRNDSIRMDDISIDGQLKLIASRWDFSGAKLYVGDWLGLEGDMSVDNPSDLVNSFFNTRIDTLWFDFDKAVSSYPSLFVDFDTINLPFKPGKLGRVFLKGSLKGKHKDFEANADFKSGVGAIKGSFSIHPGLNQKNLRVKAAYRASLMHLDSFLDIETGIGLLSADGKIEGTWDGDSVYKLRLETIMPFVQWNDYYYTNIDLEAIVQHKLYEAAIILDDDNGKMDFFGRVNLRPEDPVFDIDVMLEETNLAKLNLYKPDSIALLDLNLHASFSGKEIDEIEGQLWIEDSYFRNSRGEIPVKELSLEVSKDFSGKKIVLVSEYIDGRMNGDIFLDDLLGQLSSIGSRFLPLNLNADVIHQDRLNDFSFNINFKNPRPLAEVITKNLVFKENSQLSGFFKYGGRELDIEGNSPQFLIIRNQFTDLRFRVHAVGNDLEFFANIDKIELDQNNVFKNIKLNARMLPDLMETSLSWQENDSLKYLSEINPSLSFEPGKNTFPKIIVDLPSSTIFFKEKRWDLGDSRFELDQKYFSVSDLSLVNQNEELRLNGVISDIPGDTLEMKFKSMDLGILDQVSKGNKFDLKGLVDGDAKIFNFYDGGLFLADLTINDFVVNGERIGTTEVRSRRADNNDDVLINVLTRRGDISTLQMEGKYSPATDYMDFLFKLDKLRLNIFDPFLDPVLSEVNGVATGEVFIKGTRKAPLMNGLINVQKGSFKVNYLNSKFNFTHPIVVSENAFLVDSLIARDSLGNQAVIDGGVRHKNFKDISLDFNIKANKLLIMNTEEYQGNGYWGKVFATGLVRIKGPVGNISIDVSARTTGNSNFSIPISGKGKTAEFDFITWKVRENPDKDPDLLSFNAGKEKQGYNAATSKLKLNLDIDVTPEVKVFLIFDAQVGDIMSARGSGNIQIGINTIGLFTLNGDYIIDEGEYLFTLQNMPIKRFAIESGSNIKWAGKVNEAQLDIDAVYNTKAALYDLLLEESAELTERVPVTCHLLMQGILESPDLSFAINLPPSSDDMARSQLEGLTEDELKKQLFSLLILNRFQPLPGLVSNSNTRSYGNAGLATTTSVLSSQLNYWLSQISNDFDIGFNYRPGDQITSDEVEVALSTQIFNNRMSINLNGNMDMRSSQDEASQLVGDVDIEYKIRPSGKVRIKAFNRSNDRLIYEYSPYTQGLGLFFREEFDTIGDLVQKYWDGVFRKENP